VLFAFSGLAAIGVVVAMVIVGVIVYVVIGIKGA